MRIFPIDRSAAEREPSQRMVRRIETENFVYTAWQSRAGRLTRIVALPVSAAARYWLEGQGLSRLTLTARLEALAHVISDTEGRLTTWWGPALDYRRDW